MNKKVSAFSSLVISLRFVVAVPLLLLVVACHTGLSLSTANHTTQGVKQAKNPYTLADITTKIIPSVNNTFGYDILLYGRPFVHQPNIPGLPGNEGFATQERAQAVADLVKKKIRDNEMPPTVTIEELNTMGVLK
jgi:hypothetical protein